jgi:hypothetical protein
LARFAEIHDELSIDGFQCLAFSTEGDPGANGKRTGLKQGIFHARDACLHGLERGEDGGAFHAFCAQVTNLLDLEQIKKRKGLAESNQAGSLPPAKLPGRNTKDPEQIRMFELSHGYLVFVVRAIIAIIDFQLQVESKNSLDKCAGWRHARLIGKGAPRHIREGTGDYKVGLQVDSPRLVRVTTQERWIMNWLSVLPALSRCGPELVFRQQRSFGHHFTAESRHIRNRKLRTLRPHPHGSRGRQTAL